MSQPFRVSVDLDDNAARTLLRRLGSDKLKAQAQSRALNHTAGTANTIVKRKLMEAMSLRNRKFLNRNMRVYKSRESTLTASIRGSGQTVAYAYMKGVSEQPGSVVVSKRHGSGTKTHQRAFKTRLTTGHLGYFQRRSPGTRRIRELKGPAIPWAMQREIVTKAFNDHVPGRYIARLRHEINRIIQRAKARSATRRR